MNRRAFFITMAVAAAVAFYFAARGPRTSCTTCLSFKGRSSCGTASGGDAAAAVEKARQKACSRVAGDSLALCLAIPPTSTQCTP
jgi:hypothetical protein